MSLGQLSCRSYHGNVFSSLCLGSISLVVVSRSPFRYPLRTTDSISLGGDFDFGYVKLTPRIVIIRLSKYINTADRAGYDSFSGGCKYCNPLSIYFELFWK